MLLTNRLGFGTLLIAILAGCERPQAIPGSVAADSSATAARDTTSASRAVGAPSPPGGYAVETSPAQGGMLAAIEYWSTQSVEEIGDFYEHEIDATHRFAVGEGVSRRILYTLSSRTTVSDEVTTEEIDDLQARRTEPVVIVEPWSVSAQDPLVKNLREANQIAQAQRLMETKSRTTIVYSQPK